MDLLVLLSCSSMTLIELTGTTKVPVGDQPSKYSTCISDAAAAAACAPAATAVAAVAVAAVAQHHDPH
jgi:hypothetical protein